MRDRTLLSRLYVEDVADKVIAFAVIPNDLTLRTGNPLQHTALLPTPSRTFAQLNPTVIVRKIDHADANRIIRPRRAMLEIDFHAEHVAIRRIEFQLVVVAKP